MYKTVNIYQQSTHTKIKTNDKDRFKHLQNQIWRIHRENINDIICLSCIIHSDIMSQYDNLDVLCDNQHDVRKHMPCGSIFEATNVLMTPQSRLIVQTYVCMRKRAVCQYFGEILPF